MRQLFRKYSEDIIAENIYILCLTEDSIFFRCDKETWNFNRKPNDIKKRT
jgi:hypothetical protein